MGQFMCDHSDRALLLWLRRGLGVDEQKYFAEGHTAGVLHCSERKVGNREKIDLVAEVRHAEVVGEPTQTERGGIVGEADLITLTRTVDDADRDTIDVDRR